VTCGFAYPGHGRGAAGSRWGRRRLRAGAFVDRLQPLGERVQLVGVEVAVAVQGLSADAEFDSLQTIRLTVCSSPLSLPPRTGVEDYGDMVESGHGASAPGVAPASPMLCAWYPMTGPNEPVRLYHGRLVLALGQKTLRVSGSVRLDWLPTPRLMATAGSNARKVVASGLNAMFATGDDESVLRAGHARSFRLVGSVGSRSGGRIVGMPR
jgi:hypothetical protein